MHRLDLILLVALVGCEPAMPATPDAEIDESRVPFTTTGTTPAGSLDGVRYISAWFFGGFCGSAYSVRLYETNELDAYAVVAVDIPVPYELSVPPTGTIAVSAWYGIDHPHRTDVSFEIVHVDLPVMPLLRIAGRVTASTGAWNLDFAFDAQAELVNCI